MHFTVIKQDSNPLLSQQKKFVTAFNTKKLIDKKIAEKYLSRKALQAVAQLAGQVLGPSDLVLNHHHYIDKCPDHFFSLSHTTDYAAAIVVSSNAYLGAGIDIELKQREFTASHHRFFTHKEDDQDIPKLNLWCIKEAIYKASSHLIADTYLLKDIIVSPKCSFIIDKKINGTDCNITGTWQIIAHPELIIATALIFK